MKETIKNRPKGKKQERLGLYMKQYLLALDQGTTSSRSILFDMQGNICSMVAREFPQIFPHEGWVEHDANEIWRTQLTTAQDAMAKIGAQTSDIAAIGITNQRETTVIWDRTTGEPIYHAIVWQCRRTAGLCDKLKAQGLSETIQQKTGLLIDSYFSATKIQWILENVPGAKAKADRGELAFGTIDSWLIYRLTGGKIHATDYSNAARTMLFNIRTLEWDKELLALFGIPASMMPEVVPSSGVLGYTDASLFGGAIPIAGVAGDQQAALFGQCCFEAGSAKNTYGTGGFLLMNTGNKPVFSQKGLVTTIAWGIDGKIDYALEGSVFICGAAVQWLRDGLGLFEKASQTEDMARAVQDTGGVYLVPAFVGLGAPYWDPYARGAIMGLTRGTNRNHLARAVLESMAYQTRDVLEAMQEEVHANMTSLKVDGGASANNLLLQFQADILNFPILRPGCVETTALGAANLAGLAVGCFSSTEDIIKHRRIDREFLPQMDSEERSRKLRGWHKAVNRTLDWAEH